MKDPTLHRDGTVTYFSTYNQTWHERVGFVPDEELAAMPQEDRDRVIKHLGGYSETCQYCGREQLFDTYDDYRAYQNGPLPSTEEDWAEEAKHHGSGCEWVETRVHSRD